MSYHSRAGDRAIIPLWVRGLRPVRATELIAAMLAEERTDSLRAKVGYAVFPVPRQDNGVGEDDLAAVDAAL